MDFVLQLLNTYTKLKTAIDTKDWATVVSIVGDLVKSAAVLFDKPQLAAVDHAKVQATVDAFAVDPSLAGLDPATLAILLELMKLGLTWLVNWFKARHGLPPTPTP